MQAVMRESGRATAADDKWAALRDLSSAWLLGTALSLALMPSIGHPVGLLESALYVLAALVIWWGVTRRWWIGPALLLGGGIAAFFIYYLALQDTGLMEYWTGFFAWWQSGCPVLRPYSENGALELVRLVSVFLPAGLIWLYYRRLFCPVSFLLTCVGSGVLTGWLYISESEHLIAVLALLSIALLTGLARICGGSIMKRLGREKTVSVSLMQLCALVLAAAAAVFSVLIIPKKDGSWQWKGLVQFVQDVGDLYLEGNGRLSDGSGFSIGRSGFMPLGEKLGGDINPNNDIVLRVKTDTPTLLAGAVYNTYDGERWYDTGTLGSYRYRSIFWRGKRNDVFSVKYPLGGRRAARIYEKMAMQTSLTISTGLHTASYFTAGSLRAIQSDDLDKSEPYFNLQGELYSESVRPGGRYTVTASVYNRESADFDYYMELLESELDGVRDPQWEEIAAVYLALPETLPGSVAETALEITDGIDSPYLKAKALEEWLHENCTYTLTPGDPDEGEDFVAQFLDKKEGYCVYYATAMAVMARAAGLPSRYVTGYGLKENPERVSAYPYVATNATAHAWCEVYFSGIGWVAFDPTGWNPYEPAAQDEPEPVIEAEAETAPPPAIPEQMPEDIPAPTPEPEPEETPVPWGKILVLPCVCLLILLALWVRVLLKRRGIDQRYRRLMRRYPDYPARIDRCWAEILSQLNFMGLSPAPDDTLSVFADKVSARVPQFRAEAERMEQIRFAMKVTDDEDLKALCRLSRSLERRLQEEMGRWKYFWRRMIIGR